MNPTRWAILFLIFLATGLSFLDRQVLSVTIIKIQEEFGINDVQYGLVNTGFLISYAVMFTIGGYLVDRFGAKTGMAFSVGIWSAASLLHGFMNGFYQLVVFRFILGMGEGGCFPAAAKAVSELYEPEKRALANGIAIGGSAVGAVVAPPLTIWISSSLGWRWSFIIPGIFAGLWLIAWMLISWRKAKPDQGNGSVAHLLKLDNRPSFINILRNRATAAFVVIRFLLDPVFYFIMFWIPKYLHDQRAVSFEAIGQWLWIPFLALGLSNIAGGYISDKLIKRNFSVNRARKTVMGIAALLSVFAVMVQSVSSLCLAIVMMSVLMLAHGLWITNYITVIADVFGSKATSTVVGLSGTAGAIGGLLVNPLIGLVVERFSYTPLWVICGLMYPVGMVILCVFVPNIQMIKLKTNVV